ncbi:MAG: hypothetical protein HGB08_03045 [Candidatus Moranbacteria bacterium]|nr:hypothetical protein [Candidatus Moranbacteria bacterium]
MTLDQMLSIVNIFVSIVIAIIVYCLSKKLSAKEVYNHEIFITKEVTPFLGRKAILTDVKKYDSKKYDRSQVHLTNKDYYKQACKIHRIVQRYGIEVELRDSDKFVTGLIPFEWVEYIAENDSEDTSIIIVCKFKGIKWYKNFKSPIKEILNQNF